MWGGAAGGGKEWYGEDGLCVSCCNPCLLALVGVVWGSQQGTKNSSGICVFHYFLSLTLASFTLCTFLVIVLFNFF